MAMGDNKGWGSMTTAAATTTTNSSSSAGASVNGKKRNSKDSSGFDDFGLFETADVWK
jgi:hypothetical protein